MAIMEAPIIEQWYQHHGNGPRFLVTAVDEEGGTVEVQHFDGDLGEIELSRWYLLDIEPIEQPEDWTGAIDSDTDEEEEEESKRHGETLADEEDWDSYDDGDGGDDEEGEDFGR